jgi:hypothetical protein
MRFVFVSFLENARQTRWRTGFIAAVHSTYRHASKNPHRAGYFDRGGPQTRHTHQPPSIIALASSSKTVLGEVVEALAP